MDRSSPLRPLRLTVHSRSFAVADHPIMAHAVAEFTSGREEGTLQFFDAALPHCRQCIDVGAYVGMLSLYAADRVAEIIAFEPSPTHLALLQANLAADALVEPHARRIRVMPAALGPAEAVAPLYRKGVADSGASLFQSVERVGILRGEWEAEIKILPAASTLFGLGLDPATLVKIDIEGAEYAVIPAMAPLLEVFQPFLHLSLHPFNLLADSPAATEALRLRESMALADALQNYPYIYLFQDGGWILVTQDSWPRFRETYLLKAKPIPGIATPQYGFIDAAGFSPVPLALPATPF